jgi:hypothetical protein
LIKIKKKIKEIKIFNLTFELNINLRNYFKILMISQFVLETISIYYFLELIIKIFEFPLNLHFEMND